MAALVKSINARIRSNKYTDYICSTRTCDVLFFVWFSDADFRGPAGSDEMVVVRDLVFSCVTFL